MARSNSRTGTGTFVAELPMEPLVAALAALLSKKKDAMADIFEMRRLIEPQIASLAATSGSMGNFLYNWSDHQTVRPVYAQGH